MPPGKKNFFYFNVFALTALTALFIFKSWLLLHEGLLSSQAPDPKSLTVSSQPAVTALIPQALAANTSSDKPISPDPVMLKVPAIKLSAPIVKTGLETGGALHVPGSPEQTGWYSLGTIPGDIGPAVITGHLDSAQGPGVLFNLKKIKPGDEIDVVRDDGSIAVFSAEKLARYPQDNFNTQAVYGPINTAGLRIITCSGIYNKAAKHYSDDLVVFGSLKQIQAAGTYQAK